MPENTNPSYPYQPGNCFSTVVNVTVAGNELVGQNPNRRSLIISGASTAQFFVSFGSLTPPGTGICMGIGQYPLVLDRITYGALVTGPIFANSPTAPQNVTVAEEVAAQL